MIIRLTDFGGESIFEVHLPDNTKCVEFQLTEPQKLPTSIKSYAIPVPVINKVEFYEQPSTKRT